MLEEPKCAIRTFAIEEARLTIFLGKQHVAAFSAVEAETEHNGCRNAGKNLATIRCRKG